MPAHPDIVYAQLARVPCCAATSLADCDELANAGVAITEHARPRLLARHEDLVVEDDDRAIAAACDALHQQLLGGGEDLTSGRVELRARVDDGHVLVAGAVVWFEQNREPELLRVCVGAPDVTRLAQSPDVPETASGRNGIAATLEHVRGGLLVESYRRCTHGVEVPVQSMEVAHATRWQDDPARVVRVWYDLY